MCGVLEAPTVQKPLKPFSERVRVHPPHTPPNHRKFARSLKYTIVQFSRESDMPRVAATRRVSSPTPGVALRRVSGVRGAATHVVLHALHLGEARDGASQGEVLIGRSVVVGITSVLVGEDGPPGALVRVRVRVRVRG